MHTSHDSLKKCNNLCLRLCDITGEKGLHIINRIVIVLHFCISVFLSFGHLIQKRAIFRTTDWWYEMEQASVRALPIVFLISFMIGIILAFVGIMQLSIFGADIYVAALLAIAMTRILGAIMTGIIMAGRTGASYAAQIGAMRINQEIDALTVMGVSPFDYLVLPRMLALTMAMPILTIIADIVGILGGAFVALMLINVSMTEYWSMTYDWLTFKNFAIGVFHGWIYGWIIALCGCYYGMNSRRSADGIGRATTHAVVAGITWCVVATAILTLIFNWLGI